MKSYILFKKVNEFFVFGKKNFTSIKCDISRENVISKTMDYSIKNIPSRIKF